VGLKQRRDIRAQEGYPVVFLQTGGPQVGRQAVDSLLKFPVGIRPVAMHNGDFVGHHISSSLQKANRRQLRPIDCSFFHDRFSFPGWYDDKEVNPLCQNPSWPGLINPRFGIGMGSSYNVYRCMTQ